MEMMITFQKYFLKKIQLCKRNRMTKATNAETTILT